MHASNLFRPFSSILAIAVSVVIFVGCQRDPEEILEEDPPPASDSNSHRLNAIYVLNGLETGDTEYIFRFNYDDLNRLKKMSFSFAPISNTITTNYFYDGSNKLPYLSVLIWDYPTFDFYEIDSSFLLFDEGMIVYDSVRIYSRPDNAPQTLDYSGYEVHQYSKLSDSLIRIKFLERGANNPGNDDLVWEREVLIVESSLNAFQCKASQLNPASAYSGFARVEFSDFKNPLAGLIPTPVIPDLEDDVWHLFSGFFPKYASRFQEDPNDLSELNHRVTVLKHVDFYPVQVKIENYNDLDDYPYQMWYYAYD